MKKIGLFIIVIMLFSNAGCDVIEGSNPEFVEGDPSNFEITLKNNDLEEAHMWITGEQISPLNKLEPGKSRVATYWKSAELMKDEIEEETMTIYAGRNGVTLATKSITITKGSRWSGFKLKATYTGTKIR